MGELAKSRSVDLRPGPIRCFRAVPRPGSGAGHTWPVPTDSNDSDNAPLAKDAAPQEDEVRRQYREALERKKSKAGGASSATGDTNKAGGATSNGKTQRMFRRKSGG